jgi:nucleolar complex protein 3
LNIDLAEFIARLYALMLPLSLSPTIQVPVQFGVSLDGDGAGQQESNAKSYASASLATEADLLFRALNFVFLTSRTPNPPTRTLAFSKRLLSSSLHWPGATALRALNFLRKLIVKEPKLEGMLTTEDRQADGVYRPEVDDPSLVNPEATVWYELTTLVRSHYDPRVREEASKLAHYVRD